MDRVAALEAFAAVADLGGFGAAARRLGVSPPAVTRAIGGLEDRYGVALFVRTTRSVRLTAEGAEFLARCRQVLADLAEAEDAVMGARAEVQGRLAVTAPVTFGRLHVVPVVTTLLRAHPLLSIELTLIDRTMQLVEEGLDVAVRIGELPDSGLRAIRIGEVRRVLVASPAYLAAAGTPRASGDLADHAVIAFTGIGDSAVWRFAPAERGGAATLVRLRPRLVVDSADAAIAAAVSGLGVTMALSYQVSGTLAAGALATVLDGSQGPALPIHLLYPPSRAPSARLRAFSTAMKAHLRGRPL